VQQGALQFIEGIRQGSVESTVQQVNGSPLDAPETSPASQLELLRLLEQHPEYSQRQLAVALGLSLGKTHYLLKALLGKGWVKANNFRRSDNKLGYLYMLTSHGVRQRLQLTQAFLVRKEREYEILKNQIVSLREELAAQVKAQP
jgi:MarR family transcriptional regulator, temperature-dependent positive regulator of motility